MTKLNWKFPLFGKYKIKRESSHEIRVLFFIKLAFLQESGIIYLPKLILGHAKKCTILSVFMT